MYSILKHLLFFFFFFSYTGEGSTSTDRQEIKERGLHISQHLFPKYILEIDLWYISLVPQVQRSTIWIGFTIYRGLNDWFLEPFSINLKINVVRCQVTRELSQVHNSAFTLQFNRLQLQDVFSGQYDLSIDPDRLTDPNTGERVEKIIESAYTSFYFYVLGL